MQERIDTLESQLAEKEQLVTALTERLEQAAEQLDRLHRTGADRAMRAGFAGIPQELIEQQQKLVDDLQRAVQQWEDMQPGQFFGRLETQLTDLRDMVSNIDASGGGSQGGSSGYSSVVRSGGHSGEQRESRRSPGDSPKSILDMMKSSMMEASAPEAPASQEAAETPAAAAPTQVVEVNLPPLQEAPEPVDIAAASSEELGKACEVRDAYIIYLLQRLRKIESLGHVPNSWAGLENIPGEMRVRLEALEKRLEETLRLAEVELSLQRAKLAREEARVRTMDDQMQKEIRRAKNESDSQEGAHADETASGSRWRRMLGKRGGDA